MSRRARLFLAVAQIVTAVAFTIVYVVDSEVAHATALAYIAAIVTGLFLEQLAKRNHH